MSATPRTTVVALAGTLALTAAAVVIFLAQENKPEGTRSYLALFGGLFAVRVVGQLAVIVFRPPWLPPSATWNFLPYPILLPSQLLLLALIGAVLSGRVDVGPARALVVGALVYWAAMGVRYALRMFRRPEERWFGGAIPIVFHCVLAAFVFVLGIGGTAA
jgi:hypothetical protein